MAETFHHFLDDLSTLDWIRNCGKQIDKLPQYQASYAKNSVQFSLHGWNLLCEELRRDYDNFHSTLLALCEATNNTSMKIKTVETKLAASQHLCSGFADKLKAARAEGAAFKKSSCEIGVQVDSVTSPQVVAQSFCLDEAEENLMDSFENDWWSPIFAKTSRASWADLHEEDIFADCCVSHH